MITRNSILLALTMLLVPVLFNACSSSSSSNPLVSIPLPTVGAKIDTTIHGGTVKGTMLAGLTFYMDSDYVVNKGDTLLIQEGVTVIVRGASPTKFPEFQVYGTMICNGSQAKPIYITVEQNKRTYGNLQVGLWGGIQCATSSGDLILHWTHLEYGGGAGSSVGKGTNAYVIFFQNQNTPVANFIMEDSWITGATDDPVRVSGGHISVQRNVWEAGSTTSGDGLNIKSGVQGDAGYNVFIGNCTNGPKLANKGGLSQTNVNFFNNTIVTCGWRYVGTGRAGSTNIEDGARGVEYNNLIVNCYTGFRLVSNPLADTAHTYYDYQWCYAHSALAQANFYPNDGVSCQVPRPHDHCGAIDANNPKFVGYDPNALPPSTYVYPQAWGNEPVVENVMKTSDVRGPRFSDRSESFTSDFHLGSGSPCSGTAYIGPVAGTTIPMMLCPQKSASNPYGATTIGLGKDFGAYQQDGSGNVQ